MWGKHTHTGVPHEHGAFTHQLHPLVTSYKKYAFNHPMSKWVRASRSNYDFSTRLAKEV